MRILILACLCASPAVTDSLCGETDAARLNAVLAGEWDREAHIQLESETLSILRQTAPEIVTLGADGTLQTAFIDDQIGSSLPLMLAHDTPYDVDAVDDMLDTTETPEFADILSDTPCGPEDLPQLQGMLPETEGMSVAGTITLIPYFDDRILEITELELKSEGALIFMTATALLTPAR
ncbi:hypothetical protein PARPLA_02908 [Rhodobacteraceae bacterium THAF1]|uniref:hypothetical protein n=1 Tax=Palleronia sp. THAF1 TaxID=2587842 RepID=UPI000F416FBF|nr:hypothetical protein [Palleronia sp. THAF1]QFU08310.1 hypothetical protein FIU81_06450 [Palleronia sp. THAF1]VDC28937.1 hypothetical protein PARPLA_02908 [Rhodobacteraceae bacterium THAF1]